MEIVLISGSVLSFSLAVVLLVKKRGHAVPDMILAIWLFIFSLNFVRAYLLLFKGSLFLLGFGYTTPLLIAALLFMYASTLMEKHKRFDRRLLLHLIPFLLANVYMSFYIYIKNTEWKTNFFEETSFSSRPFLFNLMLLLIVMIYPVYVIWIYRKLKKHVKEIKMVFSCPDQIDLFWLNYLLVSVLVLWLVNLYSKLISGYFNHLQYSDATLIIYFFDLVIIMIIGYFGFKQGLIFLSIELNNKTAADQKYKSTGLSTGQSIEYLDHLLKYMEQEKPYLQSQLTIAELAEQINIPSYQLSQIINEQLNKNFFEFVNEYRVKEFQERISKNLGDKFTLLAIALDSGFNSKSSFNNIFKKQTGLTPKQFVQQKNTA